jgi:mRNA-degrading endonuclease RelE of RelBE toxin-antitoxin system
LTIVFAEGSQRPILWGADARGRYHGKDYYDELSETEQAKVAALAQRMADHGRIHNQTRFTKETETLYCFKSGQHRFPCFFDEGNVVILAGFRKKTDWDKRLKRELKKAERHREEYLAAKGDSP